MSISALITNYKTWSLTMHCAKELERYSDKRLTEILIIDDASQQPIPKDLPKKVRVLCNQQNKGLLANMNIGFAELDADIILVFDSDAYPLMDSTKLIAQRFAIEPKLGALGFQTFNKQKQLTASGQLEPSVIGLLLGQKLEALYESQIKLKKNRPFLLYQCAIAIRRKAFEDIGGFDEGFDWLDADLDFSMRLQNKGWLIDLDTNLAAFHEGGGTFQTTSARVLRHHRNRWQLLEKHGRLPIPLLLKVLLATRHFIEYSFLKIFGRKLIPDSKKLADKLYGRQQLLKLVWTGYNKEN